MRNDNVDVLKAEIESAFEEWANADVFGSSKELIYFGKFLGLKLALEIITGESVDSVFTEDYYEEKESGLNL